MADKAERGVRAKRPRRRWIILGAAAVVLIGGLAFWFLRPQPATATTRTFNSPVTKTTETTTVNLTGTLATQKRADLSFGTSGTVTAVNVAVGQQVKSGELLATIDNTQLKNAVTLAQANLTAAQANYTSVSGTSGVTSAQLSSARAQVDSANAKLSSAKASLNDAKIVSPIDGTVATVNLTVGTTSGSSGGSSSGGSASGVGVSGTSSGASATGQIVVISPTSWMVNSSVGPADVGALKIGQVATATVAGATASDTGKIDTIGVVATTSGGNTTFPVTVLLDGNPSGFYDGVSVNLVVTTGSFPDVISVPSAAISNASGSPSVNKIVDGQPVATPVQLGKVFGDRTQVTSGVIEGDQVQITVRVAAGSTRTSGSGINFPGMGPGAGGGQPGASTGNRQPGSGQSTNRG